MSQPRVRGGGGGTRSRARARPRASSGTSRGAPDHRLKWGLGPTKQQRCGCSGRAILPQAQPSFDFVLHRGGWVLSQLVA